MSTTGRWATIRLTAPGDPATGVTVHELVGERPGPTLVVLGGVHGNEIGGIIAAARVAATDWELLAGRLVVVPVAHEAAHAADLRCSPLDDGNLARTFPGDASGAPTERLARLLTDEVLARADVLVDLHTSSPTADMPLFVGCLDDGSDAATRAVDLATTFGVPLVWTHPTLGPGRTLTVARERGIPALYVESPVGGVLNDCYLERYTDGVRSLLERLELITSSATAVRPALERWVHGDGDTDAFRATTRAGSFLGRVDLLQPVRRDETVGVVLDDTGTVVEEIRAPADGLVTTIQRTAAVSAGHPVVGITPERPARLGLPSDLFIERMGPAT